MYDHKLTEKKWQKRWQEEKIYQPDIKDAKNPFYNLMMFPYPSAEGLHVGNMYAFTGADVYGRFNRMQGEDVLEPIGLDGFGIHSENYAIKVGRHPKEHAQISENNFYNQLQSIGNSFAWDNRIETYDPDYYKWTQWLFIQLYKKGLAYKSKAFVNWCPSDKTVLADEQVIDGKCERCNSEVERKEMSSWFFKITEYAERLLDGLNDINWPNKIKIAQDQWIGKKQGINIAYNIKDTQKSIVCFTTRPETNFGATFIVLSPEVAKDYLDIIPEDKRKLVEEYIKTSLNKSEQQRQEEGRDKSGEFTGLYAVNRLNGRELPVWVGDFVLSGFGTGAVVGVPGHDKRDFEFAHKFGLEVVRVMVGTDGDTSPVEKGDQVCENGKMVNSDFLDGLDPKEASEKVISFLEEKGWGERKTLYHLRDWLISRQRYWGAPIPMVNCSKCGWQPVAESELPVVLPEISDFKPKGDGTSPLANAPSEWLSVKCPSCEGEAKRETDVSDTFLDSSWYFLRYPSLNLENSENEPFDPEVTKKWLPVNTYIGGAEHAVLHLLYARFVTMVLHDLGKVSFDEPFPYLFGHGLIIKDGAKMSKSKGNVVVPDEYINKFGADTLRTYLMFLGSYDQGGDFRDTGIEGMHRFIKKVWGLFENNNALKDENLVTIKMHQTIKKVTNDLGSFKFNTAIAAIMEYVNIMKEQGASEKNLEALAQLIAPFAPHMAEEIWCEVLGKEFSIHKSAWPTYDEAQLVFNEVSLTVQVNGKFRGQVVVDKEIILDKNRVLETVKDDPTIAKWLEGKEVKDTIYVEGKVINILVI
jgi:leucyl-tRNA synthetase